MTLARAAAVKSIRIVAERGCKRVLTEQIKNEIPAVRLKLKEAGESL